MNYFVLLNTVCNHEFWTSCYIQLNWHTIYTGINLGKFSFHCHPFLVAFLHPLPGRLSRPARACSMFTFIHPLFADGNLQAARYFCCVHFKLLNFPPFPPDGIVRLNGHVMYLCNYYMDDFDIQ